MKRQNWWLLTGKLAGIPSTISTEWNQAAATTSKRVSWSSAWQRQLRRQHNVTQPLLAARPSWPPAPASTLGTGPLPQANSSSHSAACPEHNFPPGSAQFPPSLGKRRVNKVFWFHSSQTWQGFLPKVYWLLKVTSLTRRWFCFTSTYYSFSKSKMELHSSISTTSMQRKCRCSALHFQAQQVPSLHSSSSSAKSMLCCTPIKDCNLYPTT